MSAFHPDLRRAAWWLPRGIPAWLAPIVRRLPAPPSRLPPGITVTERPIGNGAHVRVLSGPPRPTPRPAVLWIHGGGYVIGTAKQDDGTCGRIAAALDAVVLSVHYRLAPEHPFPAPLDDCFAAFELLHAEASALGIDPARVAIAGQSAGGGLAAALALRIFDAGRPPPVLQLLIYPMLDDRTVGREVVDPGFRLWNPASNRYGWTSYLGELRGDAVPDHAAPARRVDLRGLPPAWIGVGTLDLFHAEDVRYADRLREAGVQTTLEIVEGAFHGFEAAVPGAPVSQAFIAAQLAALRAALAPDPA